LAERFADSFRLKHSLFSVNAVGMTAFPAPTSYWLNRDNASCEWNVAALMREAETSNLAKSWLHLDMLAGLQSAFVRGQEY